MKNVLICLLAKTKEKNPMVGGGKEGEEAIAGAPWYILREPEFITSYQVDVHPLQTWTLLVAF